MLFYLWNFIQVRCSFLSLLLLIVLRILFLILFLSFECFRTRQKQQCHDNFYYHTQVFFRQPIISFKPFKSIKVFTNFLFENNIIFLCFVSFIFNFIPSYNFFMQLLFYFISDHIFINCYKKKKKERKMLFFAVTACLLALSGLVQCESKIEVQGSVLVLTQANFDTAIKENEFILVEFCK